MTRTRVSSVQCTSNHLSSTEGAQAVAPSLCCFCNRISSRKWLKQHAICAMSISIACCYSFSFGFCVAAAGGDPARAAAPLMLLRWPSPFPAAHPTTPEFSFCAQRSNRCVLRAAQRAAAARYWRTSLSTSQAPSPLI